MKKVIMKYVAIGGQYYSGNDEEEIMKMAQWRINNQYQRNSIESERRRKRNVKAKIY